MHYKTPKDRNAILLYPNIDLWVEQNNPVRLIDLIIEKFTRGNGIELKYDADNNNFTCPNNKKLILHSKNYKQGGQTYNIYKCHDCHECPFKQKCTKSKTGRAIKININQDWMSRYKEWIGQPENIEKTKQRKKIVEHPFGTIKLMMGKLCFLLREKLKVQIEVDLYTTAYNLKRLITIENMNLLLQKVESYDWKVV